jgi:transposase
MNEISQAAIVRVGVDLSKKYFQVHAITQLGEVTLAKAFSRDRFFTWCSEARR